ncbi:gelsolin-like protein 1 [Xenia sp. Carnegie-2017]|uniref:gelsolin-like protein 1 n=1 Tax=Xenia sp. Carnegie-2017 TaxID=2897299 RepID=UPI001F043219|nr:gelsolin-like protein 1 [Xenia sp. Carnegie-2017]
MSQLEKAKKYVWKDSNLALFDSDIENKVKKSSADSEKAWEKAGKRPGIQIWRIVKFKVTNWPKDEYGKFYNGDSYIILRTYQKPNTDELLYDLHFWIGKYSTQDEYGAAAYKTVELDTYLNEKPVQHREVQEHESQLFRSYFKEITFLKGGAETGFRHVEPTKYTPRLFQFRREKKWVKYCRCSICSSYSTTCFNTHNYKGSVIVKEVPCFKESLDSSDVFVFDGGYEIYQWNGINSNKDERFIAYQYMQNLKSQRNNRPRVETLEEDRISPKNAFRTKLQSGGKPKKNKGKDTVDAGAREKKLYRISDNSGSLRTQLVASGDISRDNLKSEDAFVLDHGEHVFVWIGSRASEGERKNALPMAHLFLQQSDHPFVPTTVIIEGKGVSKEFDAMFQ